MPVSVTQETRGGQLAEALPGPRLSLLALTRDGTGSFTTAIDTLTGQPGPARS